MSNQQFRPASNRRITPAFTVALSLMSPSGWAADPIDNPVIDSPSKVEAITVTASPFDRDQLEMAQPASVLRDRELQARRKNSLGDTLDGQLGVHSSSFGPGAGRPIICGQDGPRVRVLQNGTGTLDVSTLSPDHAVTIEPMNAQQIEVLRGPATLLYGPNAVGGVVNVVSDVVPRRLSEKLSGEVELQAGSADHERTGAAKVRGSVNQVAFQGSAYQRSTTDYRLPIEPGKLDHSAVKARGGSVGVSLVGEQMWGGVGGSHWQSDYGIPGPEGARIAMRQNRFDATSEWENVAGGLEKIKLRLTHNDYRHQEIEATGEVATTFTNRAHELRAEFVMSPIAAMGGARTIFGVQSQGRQFSAVGEETIVPATSTRELGLFGLAEKRLGALLIEGGLRVDQVRHNTVADAPSRRFSLAATSLGATWLLGGGLRAAISAAHAERAPAIEELYSKGAHLATQSYEVGDSTLRKETANNIDLSLNFNGVANGVGLSGKVSVFASRYRNYVYGAYLDTDGDGEADRVNTEGELVPLDEEGALLIQQFSQARARFYGAEAELSWAWKAGNQIRVFADQARGVLVGGGSLPRQSPKRFGASFALKEGPWSGRAEVTRVASQTHLAALETATGGYTKIDAGVTYEQRLSADKNGATLTWFANGTNLANATVRIHTSYLKDVAPQRGRSVLLGVRGQF